MFHITHILFPVDLSEACGKIVPFVRAWAAHFDARVTLLNVFELPAMYTGSATSFSEENLEILLEDRKQRLDSFAKESFRGPEDQRVVKEGYTTAEILEFIERERVSLVMMPTHGYGPFRRFLLGSVTAKVLHDCAIPVWTGVHAEQPAAAWTPPDCRHVLCAIDLTPQSVVVMTAAQELAKSYRATLRFVHAVAGWPRSSGIPRSDEFESFIFNYVRKEIATLQQQAGTNAEVEVRGGEVAHVVHHAALDCNADLLVIGRGVLQKPLGRLRTHSYSIIRESPCPVISV